MTLKKFIKYFDNMTKLCIMEFDNNEHGRLLFEGYVFDKGAKKILKNLYEQNYKLDRNEDGCAVMIFISTENEYGVREPFAQVNVKRG